MEVYRRMNSVFTLLLIILLREGNCSFLHQQSTPAANNVRRPFPFAPILPASGRPFASAPKEPGSGSLRGSVPQVFQTAGDWGSAASEWGDRLPEQKRAIRKAVIKAVRSKNEVSGVLENLADEAKTVGKKASEVLATVVDPSNPGSKMCVGAVSVVAHFALEAAAELAEAAASGGWTEATLRSVSIAIRVSAEQAEAAAALTKDLTGEHVTAEQVHEVATSWARAATLWQTAETAITHELHVEGPHFAAKTTEAGSDILVKVLIGLFAGCGLICAALCLRRGSRNEALLLA
jgi:hypothetical protein